MVLREYLIIFHGEGIWYQMIPRQRYQNLINKRYLYKNNYSLTHVFHLLVEWLFFADMSHIYWILIPLTWYHLIQNIFSIQ